MITIKKGFTFVIYWHQIFSLFEWQRGQWYIFIILIISTGKTCKNFISAVWNLNIHEVALYSIGGLYICAIRVIWFLDVPYCRIGSYLEYYKIYINLLCHKSTFSHYLCMSVTTILIIFFPLTIHFV